MKVKKECALCGKEFEVYPSKIKKGYINLYCSMRCYNDSKKGKGNPNWKNKTEKRKCKVCGKEYKYIPRMNDDIRKRGKYCSKKCLYESLIKKVSQEEAKILLTQLRESPLSLIDFAKNMGTTDRIIKRMITNYFPDEYETAQESRRLKKDEMYKKGRKFETKTRFYLQKLGYIVMPSPRSLGPADLLAVKNGEILLIQCKVYGTLRKKGRIALDNMAKNAGGIPLMATENENGEIVFNIPNGETGKKRIEWKPKE